MIERHDAAVRHWLVLIVRKISAVSNFFRVKTRTLNPPVFFLKFSRYRNNRSNRKRFFQKGAVKCYQFRPNCSVRHNQFQRLHAPVAEPFMPNYLRNCVCLYILPICVRNRNPFCPVLIIARVKLQEVCHRKNVQVSKQCCRGRTDPRERTD